MCTSKTRENIDYNIIGAQCPCCDNVIYFMDKVCVVCEFCGTPLEEDRYAGKFFCINYKCGICSGESKKAELLEDK